VQHRRGEVSAHSPLRDERVSEGVPEGVPTDIAGRPQERYEHVRPDESEDCIREDTGSGRRAIGRVAPEPTPGYLPIQTHDCLSGRPAEGALAEVGRTISIPKGLCEVILVHVADGPIPDSHIDLV
jgi:hypothetical protein